MIDIDNFKSFNDKFGHLRGDWLLKKTADILASCIREDIDIVVRYGGDEFIMLLVNTTSDTAKEIAERILQKYTDLKNQYDVSLSIGISQIKDNMEASELLRKADGKMYQVKSTGGNNIF